MSEHEPNFREEDVKDEGPSEYVASSMQCEATRLMHAVKQGDAEAFDELVRTLRGRAFHVARSLVGSRDDAMELSQEAFLKVYRARDTFRDGELFLPWFHRILRNTCFSHLRHRGKLSERSVSAHPSGADEDDGDYEIVGDEPNPSQNIEAAESSRAFWSAFESLSTRDREILALRHFKELSYREISETLAIPEGTVMSRLFHARRRLRGALGDEDSLGGFNLDTDQKPSPDSA